ncbi:MAG: hypothetical protein AAF950_06575 [Pseudomonadota bacterium]
MRSPLIGAEGRHDSADAVRIGNLIDDVKIKDQDDDTKAYRQKQVGETQQPQGSRIGNPGYH